MRLKVLMTLVKVLRVLVGHRMILDQLFKQTPDQIEDRLFSLLLIVAVDVCYRDVLALEKSLEMIDDN